MRIDKFILFVAHSDSKLLERCFKKRNQRTKYFCMSVVGSNVTLAFKTDDYLRCKVTQNSPLCGTKSRNGGGVTISTANSLDSHSTTVAPYRSGTRCRPVNSSICGEAIYIYIVEISFVKFTLISLCYKIKKITNRCLQWPFFWCCFLCVQLCEPPSMLRSVRDGKRFHENIPQHSPAQGTTQRPKETAVKYRGRGEENLVLRNHLQPRLYKKLESCRNGGYLSLNMDEALGELCSIGEEFAHVGLCHQRVIRTWTKFKNQISFILNHVVSIDCINQ
jgi:hypothetical protein